LKMHQVSAKVGTCKGRDWNTRRGPLECTCGLFAEW